MSHSHTDSRKTPQPTKRTEVSASAESVATKDGPDAAVKTDSPPECAAASNTTEASSVAKSAAAEDASNVVRKDSTISHSRVDSPECGIANNISEISSLAELALQPRNADFQTELPNNQPSTRAIRPTLLKTLQTMYKNEKNPLELERQTNPKDKKKVQKGEIGAKEAVISNLDHKILTDVLKRGRPPLPPTHVSCLPVAPAYHVMAFGKRLFRERSQYVLGLLVKMRPLDNILNPSYEVELEDIQHNTAQSINDALVDENIDIKDFKKYFTKDALKYVANMIKEKKKIGEIHV